MESMKNTRIAEEVKNAIMKDLFVDVNTQKCIIDIFLQGPKEFEEMKDTINKVSITFLNKCKQQLKVESDKWNILFFRKYHYEKILNEYLVKTYKIETLEMSSFPSERKLKEDKRRKEEVQLKKQREIEEQKLLEEKKRKEREQQEREVLAHLANLGWKKTVGVSSTVYEATFYDGKKVELNVIRTTKKKNTTTSFSLKYDKKQFYCVEYEGKTVVQVIEETHPKVEKNSKLIYVVNTDVVAKKKESKINVDLEVIRKQNEAAEKKKAKKEEERKLKEERRRLHEERMKAEQEAKRIRQIEQQEKMRKMEAEQQEQLRKLPQIGVKDFLVRRAVFKCMHSKHKVEDLVAAVKVIGDDGREKIVKITAGYCEQCKIYFIMESTYEKLRNMGVVLCRICDEKSYMKNTWVNGIKLAQESILMQFGYTVSQEEGLSSSRRQKILAVMIDNKVLSKSEIISYLDFFISQRQYQRKFELAVSKWEADREFVQEYKVGQYTQFGVNAIYRR